MCLGFEISAGSACDKSLVNTGGNAGTLRETDPRPDLGARGGSPQSSGEEAPPDFLDLDARVAPPDRLADRRRGARPPTDPGGALDLVLGRRAPGRRGGPRPRPARRRTRRPRGRRRRRRDGPRPRGRRQGGERGSGNSFRPAKTWRTHRTKPPPGPHRPAGTRRCRPWPRARRRPRRRTPPAPPAPSRRVPRCTSRPAAG